MQLLNWINPGVYYKLLQSTASWWWSVNFKIVLHTKFLLISLTFHLSSHHVTLLIYFSTDHYNDHDFPHDCPLLPNDAKNTSGCAESMEKAKAEIELLFHWCIFWSRSRGQIRRPVCCFSWKASSHACHVERGASILRHSTSSGTIFGVLNKVHVCLFNHSFRNMSNIHSDKMRALDGHSGSSGLTFYLCLLTLFPIEPFYLVYFHIKKALECAQTVGKSDAGLNWISRLTADNICKWLDHICVFRDCYPVCLGCCGNSIGMQTHTERFFSCPQILIFLCVSELLKASYCQAVACIVSATEVYKKVSSHCDLRIEMTCFLINHPLHKGVCC